MNSQKQLIRNGRIVDGTGRAGYPGAVAVENGRIVQVGGDAPADFDGEVFDAAGKIVCPGFIDTHSHSDLRLLEEPDVLPKISQGITTELLGQDGVSVAPLSAGERAEWPKNVAGLLGTVAKPWNWLSVSEYAAALRAAGPATNLQYLAPHGNVRLSVLGMAGRPATAAERGKMQALLADCLDAGCAGMSTGLIYPPCTFADHAELRALCDVLARKGKPLVVHQRSEADTILESMAELTGLARETGVHVHISHFKLCGRKNWGKIGELLAILDRAEAEGLAFSFDQYPYTAGSTMLSVILPPWVHAGGIDKLFARLADREAREKIKAQIETGIPGWDNFVDFAGYDGIYITDAGTDKDAEGLSLAQLGERRGVHPLDAAFDLLLSQQNRVGILDYYGSEDNLFAIMRDRRGNFCTDGLLGGTPHPRVYGTFPRVLGRYVREKPVLTLEEAVKKMTSVPAGRFALGNRGRLAPGLRADIVVFDPETVVDTATFQNPRQLSRGIELVMVNGRPAYRAGQTGVGRHGEVLWA